MCKFVYSTEEFALLRVIAAILFSKDIRSTGQAQMSWISGDVQLSLVFRKTECVLVSTQRYTLFQNGGR